MSSQHPGSSGDEASEALTPLDYGRPAARGADRRDLILGVVICLMFSLGSGAIAFGLMIVKGLKDDIGTILAIGVAAVMLALSLVGLMVWLRSRPSQ